jgi:hypothetical protein
MTPEALVQEQLDAYNARDLQRFVACYADDVTVWRLPATEPSIRGRQALAAHYAANRFQRPNLHAELLNRMVMGNKVIDHERITGIAAEPMQAVAAYEVAGGLIQRVWFLAPE